MSDISPPAPPAAPAKMPFQAWLWKKTKRWLKILAVLYLVVCILMYAFQTYLVFPGTLAQGKNETRFKPVDGETLVDLKTPDGTPIAGLFGAADLRSRPDLKGQPRPTILYFYGNGEAVAYSRGMAEFYRAMGYHCMLVDYEGFGMSGGKASEQGCYDAAEAAYQHLLTRPDVDKTHIVVAGWSLGGGVAIDLAYRHRNDHTLCALMTFSTFSSMVATAQDHYPFLPVSLLLKHRFMSIEKVPSLTIPYFLGHGKADAQISYSQSDQLAAAYGNPAMITRYSSTTADHNDFFDINISQLNDAIESFLQKVVK